MSLPLQILSLALCMSILSALPLFSAGVRRHERRIFLAGTGAMLGICLFDLVPDVFELGRWQALAITGGVWLAYSAIHSFNFFHHHHDPERIEGDCVYSEPRRFGWFLGPLLAHGAASGMLLSVSQGFAPHLAGSIYLALLAHKAYESILLSSILLPIRRPLRWKLGVIAAYASALPAGAGVLRLGGAGVGERIAVLISAVAVGTLLGCLVFDFLLPSLRQLRQRSGGLVWVLGGFVGTRLLMFWL